MIKLHSVGAPKTTPYEYLTVGAGNAQLGQAMILTNGVLVYGGDTVVPEFIAVKAGVAGEIIPVIRIVEDMIFGTKCLGDTSTLYVGNKVTLDKGTYVTDVTTDGVFMITEILAENNVRGMFRR